MKKLCVLIAVLLLLSSFSTAAFAAGADFDVQNGVLVRYNGSASDVAIPNGVYAVGAEAFKGNTSLKSVDIPSTVYEVGDQAFYGCTQLSSVTGGDQVADVGDLAFSGTPYLEASTVKYLILGHALLWYNGTAEGVTIPSHCTCVASYAFMKCTYLKSFTAYEGLMKIGSGAFYGCSQLSQVDLPATVSEIGAYAFDGTPFLASLGEFAETGDHVLVKYQGSGTDVTVPDGISRIAPHAFSSSKLSRVTLPDSVYAVDDHAFADCVGLTAVEWNDGLVTIGDSAFRGCKSLKTLQTPPSLSYIGQQAFRGSGLTGAALMGEALTVSYNAFKGCGSLKYVLLSDGAEAVFNNAFDSCTALEGVSIPSSVSEIGSQALSNCPGVTVCCEMQSKAQSALSSHTVSTLTGDADRDGLLTVVDATAVQYYAAELMPFSGAQAAAADYNYDAKIDIEDAFWIQMKTADLI